MNPDELKALFQPLLGAGWQRKLAKLSLLSENTISRYQLGTRRITRDKAQYFSLLAEWYIRQDIESYSIGEKPRSKTNMG